MSYIDTLRSPMSPEDILIALEDQADEEFEEMRDRPDFVRVGRSRYVACRRNYLIDNGDYPHDR